MEKKQKKNLINLHSPSKTIEDYNFSSINSDVKMKKIKRFKNISQYFSEQKLKKLIKLTDNINENNEYKNILSELQYKIKLKKNKGKTLSRGFINMDKKKGRNHQSNFIINPSKTEVSNYNIKRKINFIPSFRTIINKNEEIKNKVNFLINGNKIYSPCVENKSKLKRPLTHDVKETKNDKNIIHLLLRNIVTEKKEIENYRKNQFKTLKNELDFNHKKIKSIFDELKRIQFYSDVCSKKKKYLLRNINDINMEYGFGFPSLGYKYDL